MDFKQRVKFHIERSSVGTRSATPAKNGKRQRKRSMSRAMRFARCAARKDINVFASSRGRFASVAEFEAFKASQYPNI